MTGATDASARPARSREPKGDVTKHRHRSAFLVILAGLALAPAANATEPASDRAPIVVRVSDGGFDWGDAAIGVAGGSALTLLVGGAVRGARRKPEASHNRV